jgi:hypothetical protein
MKMYRLRSEAAPYFKDALATQIYSWDTWNDLHVDDKALEEVKPCYLTYGHESLRPNSSSSTLGGWSDEESKFYFTVVFPNVKFAEHDKFHKGKIIRELMDKIQRNIDGFFEEFINEKQES